MHSSILQLDELQMHKVLHPQEENLVIHRLSSQLQPTALLTDCGNHLKSWCKLSRIPCCVVIKSDGTLSTAEHCLGWAGALHPGGLGKLSCMRCVTWSCRTSLTVTSFLIVCLVPSAANYGEAICWVQRSQFHSEHLTFLMGRISQSVFVSAQWVARAC